MRRLLTLTTLAVACTTRPAAPPPAPPPVATMPPTPRVPRGASATLATHWPFASLPEVVAYVDVAGLRAAPLAAALVRAVVQSASDLPGSPAQHDCVAALWLGAREVAMGGGDGGFLTVLRFEGSPPPVSACAAALGGTPGAHVQGASQAFDLDDGDVAAVEGDLGLIGSPKLVAAALVGNPAVPTLSDVVLGPDEYLALRYDKSDPPISARASLVASSDRFRLGIEGAGPDGFIEMLEHEIGDALGSDLVRSNETLAHLAKEVNVARWGTHLRVAFEVGGAPEDQAREVFSAATVTVAFVRQYMTEAKKAEAREEVSAIAQRLEAWLRNDDPADPGAKLRWKKNLFSLPPVPVAIPAGVKYASCPVDWRAWEAIHFAMTEPQYYQYEVIAAKDGASAAVVARADLNGDGKASTIKRVVTIDRAAHRVVFSPEVEEGDPDE